MKELKNILQTTRFQFHFSALLKSILGAESVFFVLGHFLNFSWLIGLLLFAFCTLTYFNGLFKNQQKNAIRLLHQRLNHTEFSLDLLEKSNPNIAEQLQLEKLSNKIQGQKTPIIFYQKTGIYFLITLVSAIFYVAYPLFKQSKNVVLEKINNQQSAIGNLQSPKFLSSRISILPPSYTNLPSKSSNDLNVSALIGSVLIWQLKFDNAQNLRVKILNENGKSLNLVQKSTIFEHQDHVLASGLYAFRAFWKDSLIYQSDYYRLDAIPDLAPKIEPTSKELYQIHQLKDPKTTQISAKISDDFLVSQAFLVATLARGSGENVKFREMKIPLVPSNFKEANLSKILDLKSMNFAPSDELYYYWAAFDNKMPEPNFTKSDTYFIVYKDTTQVEASEQATMAMNILPEYFRSQRQIIIDTEKLIKQRGKIPPPDFKSTSNEIGFDQKTLRLRYGQFLGEEFETSIGGSNAMPEEGEDFLKGFAHAHDEGEHDNEDGHQQEEEHGHSHAEHHGTKDENSVAAILEEYVHAHDDAETNTFYEQSTRSLLKMALEQMWQSELHLRIYEPEKALPFEHKALEYLKEAQQKARVFVKKTGFDPPPIKEKEKRLTGELKKLNENFKAEKKYTQVQLERLVAEVMGIAEQNTKINALQKQKVIALGNAISAKAMNNELKNWSILADLQKLINNKNLSKKELKNLKTKLFILIKDTQINKKDTVEKSYLGNTNLENAFWQVLK